MASLAPSGDIQRPPDPADRVMRLHLAQSDGFKAVVESNAVSGLLDANLLRQAATGDRQAFEILYNRYWPDLLEFVQKRYRGILDAHAAEDVASEAMFHAWEGQDNLNSIACFPAYLKSIAKNLIARRFRSRRPPEGEIPSDTASPASSTCMTLEYREIADQLARAIRLLPISQRLALELSQTGFSAKRIGMAFKCTEKAAQRRAEKARERLRQALSRCGDGCITDTHQGRCPAREKNLFCLKYWYIQSLRKHGKEF